MDKKEYSKTEYSKTDLKKMIAKAVEKLEKGVEEVFSSEKYLAYLKMLTKFHKYSFSNTMLIFLQKPESTHVAGYKTWISMKRHVNKGEKGIQILAPFKVKQDVEQYKIDALTCKIMRDKNGNKIKETKTVEFTSFKPIYVWDISQTAGEPLPTPATELKDKLANAPELIEAIKKVANVPVEFSQMQDEMKGYYDLKHNKIVIQSDMSDSQTLKTLIHELAHARLHSKERSERHAEEVQALYSAF